VEVEILDVGPCTRTVRKDRVPPAPRTRPWGMVVVVGGWEQQREQPKR
jgi:hypothetical protein